jgi:hypothetical protein
MKKSPKGLLASTMDGGLARLGSNMNSTKFKIDLSTFPRDHSF